jgi:hypothetical protein
VQAYIVEKLEHASNVSVHAATKHGLGGVYPEVCKCDLNLVDANRNHYRFENFFRGNRMSSPEHEVEVNYDVVSEASKFAIIRRLAYQAGVVKLSNGAFDSLWKDLVRLMIILVDGPCECLMTISRRMKASGPVIDLHHDIPPPKMLADHVVSYVIVPHLVEERAKALGMAHKVYGEEWLVEEGKTLELEIAEAEARYGVEP